jgi:hypothetical protein
MLAGCFINVVYPHLYIKSQKKKEAKKKSSNSSSIITKILKANLKVGADEVTSASVHIQASAVVRPFLFGKFRLTSNL